MSENNNNSPAKSVSSAGSTVRAVAAARGWDWIVDGFELFKKQPGIWILILIVFVIICLLVSRIPLVGSLASVVLAEIFLGGLMLGCRSLASGGSLEIGHLFAGFSNYTGNLVVLGVLAAVGWIVVAIPAVLIVGTGGMLAMMHGDLAGMMELGLSLVLASLITLALSIPLYMALWFAPVLIVLNGAKPVAAARQSFSACWDNIVPFLVYGIVLLVLSFAAAIPLFLGFLVLGPVIIASVYTAYRDIFAVA
ncbi:MAG TPA: BPSS1780 family membrane protein [Burkholderiales bacterium]|nr:BPSS1780 family membrane protein [Burkholderiales bacterium]